MHPILLTFLSTALLLSSAGTDRPASAPGTQPAESATTRPTSAELCDQGRDALRAGRLAEAISMLETAVTRDPTSIPARRLLVEALGKVDRPASAAKQLARIGELESKAGRHALAAEAYRDALSLQDDPAVHCALAETYCLLDRVLGPVVARLMPNAEPGRRQEGQYILQSDPERPGWFLTCPQTSAIYHVQAALDAGLDTPEVHLLHARVWLQAGRPERALDILRKREHRLPERERGDFWHAYGQTALAAGELETSLRCLKQAVSWDPVQFAPSLLECYQTLAEHYSRRGDLPAYIRCLEEASDLAPRDADLHYRLGNAYWEAGRRADAARQWQITLELDPDHARRDRLLEHLRRAPASPDVPIGPPPLEARD